MQKYAGRLKCGREREDDLGGEGHRGKLEATPIHTIESVCATGTVLKAMCGRDRYGEPGESA